MITAGRRDHADAHLAAASQARHLAIGWRRMAFEFPRDAKQCEAEANRCKDRVRWYVSRVKMFREFANGR